MKIAVTGGAGFIGAHLVERLLGAGDRVTVLDDLSTGRLENLAAVRAHPALEVLVGSVLDENRVASAFAGADRVVHLAAAVGVRLVVERPVESIRTNVLGAEVVLRQAAERGLPVLLASSSEVYGRGTRVPFREDGELVLGPTTVGRWSYACSKALDEWLALAWNREAGLPVTVARLFNTVGPRQTGRYGMVLPTFAAQALGGGPIIVHGDGSQTRCFAHVADVVSCLEGLLRREGSGAEIFNVGSREEISIRDLAERVRRAAGTEAEIRHVSHEKVWGPDFEDMPRRVPDLTRLESALGFLPSTPIDEIVRDVLAAGAAARP